MTLGTFVPTQAARSAIQPRANCDHAADVRDMVLDVVNYTATNHPRNLQTAIGPSEAGSECVRHLAHKLAGTPTDRDIHDPMPSILGVAFHDWMANTFMAENERLVKAGKPPRYLVEHRVYPDPTRSVMPRGGSSDNFDTWTGTVIDWKLLGDTQHRKYVGGYVSDKYEGQMDTYGLGFANEGWDVKNVALCVFGRAKPLRELYVYSRPWNRANAERIVSRLQKVALVVGAGVSPSQLKATPGGDCHFCPWRPQCPEGKTTS